MRKMISLILLFAFVVTMAGCGADGKYAELVEQLDAGNLEGIKAELSRLVPEFEQEMKQQAETAAQLEEYKARVEQLESALAGGGAETEQSDGGIRELVLDTVAGFMDAKGNDMIAEYESITAMEARETELIHAMEYRLGNCDGKGSTAHCLLMYISGDFAVPGGINDSLQLLLDMDTQKLYCSDSIDWSIIEACGGMPTNEEEFNIIALNSYHSYILFGADILMADSEICEALSDRDIAAINEALK